MNENNIPFQPLNGRVLIKPDEPARYAGAIALPDNNSKPTSGIIVAVSLKPSDGKPSSIRTTDAACHEALKRIDYKMDVSFTRSPVMLCDADVKVIPILGNVNAGDHVHFAKYAGNDITIYNQTYVVVKEGDLIGVTRQHA